VSLPQRSPFLFAILAPCAIIAAVRVLSGLGPSTAPAATADLAAHGGGAVGPAGAGSPAVPPVPPAETARLAALSTHIAALQRNSKIICPMDQPPELQEPAPAPGGVTIISPVQPGELRLSATLGRGDTASAVINGKMLNVGDSVDKYTVVSIDAAAFAVVLQDAQGAQRTLTRR